MLNPWELILRWSNIKHMYCKLTVGHRYGWLQISPKPILLIGFDAFTWVSKNLTLSRKQTNIGAVDSGHSDLIIHVNVKSCEAQIYWTINNINFIRPFYETSCPQVHHVHDYVFIGLSWSLYSDDCIFMCVLVCNVVVDYITPLWFSNYPSDRPGSGNDLWEFVSAFWLCRPTVNQFDFWCLSEPVCIYTYLKQVRVCSLCEVFLLSLTRPMLPIHCPLSA